MGIFKNTTTYGPDAQIPGDKQHNSIPPQHESSVQPATMHPYQQKMAQGGIKMFVLTLLIYLMIAGFSYWQSQRVQQQVIEQTQQNYTETESLSNDIQQQIQERINKQLEEQGIRE